MFSGRFAQCMEAAAIGLILFGIFALCQGLSFGLYSHGFTFLVAGWIGLTLWSHRRPVRPRHAEGNPQETIDGHPPMEVTIRQRKTD